MGVVIEVPVVVQQQPILHFLAIGLSRRLAPGFFRELAHERIEKRLHDVIALDAHFDQLIGHAALDSIVLEPDLAVANVDVQNHSNVLRDAVSMKLKPRGSRDFE